MIHTNQGLKVWSKQNSKAFKVLQFVIKLKDI